MTDNLYTIAEIAARLKLSESTVRYYRDKFIEYVPAIGEGKKRRYRPEAFEALQFIADSLRSGKTAEETQQGLNLKFQREIKIAAIAAAESQQVNLPAKFAEMIAVQAEAMKQIAYLLQKMDVHIQEMGELKATIATQKANLDSRDKELTEAKTVIAKARSELQKLLQIKQESEQKAKVVLDQQLEVDRLRAENTRLKLPFWRRWFFRK
jgi:DNA-binding transcriptional MerR regulator